METNREWELLLNTPGSYSMETAVKLLVALEQEGCGANDNSWKTKGRGNLVEVGIEVTCGSIVFVLMCNYEDIFIKRVSGNKAKYYERCETLRLLSRESA